MGAIDVNEEFNTLHVHDLPQLYTKPSAEALLSMLDLLKLQPVTFEFDEDAQDAEVDTIDDNQNSAHEDCSRNINTESGKESNSKLFLRTPLSSPVQANQKSNFGHSRMKVQPEGVPRYLTSVVASSLSWLTDDSIREQIWDAASARLSERSGRTAMPDMTRSFRIDKALTIELHEPTLTGDNLGLKTWSSSLVLARKLRDLERFVASPRRHHQSHQDGQNGHSRRTENSSGKEAEKGNSRTIVLELGAGTGLVGIAAACIWQTDVVLTDLPEIIHNLQRNIEHNAELASENGAKLSARALDWAESEPITGLATAEDHACDSDNNTKGYPNCATEPETFEIILAADPIYSPNHPKILSSTVDKYLSKSCTTATLIMALPLREGYEHDRTELQQRLEAKGLYVVEEGVENGRDDWVDEEGNGVVVRCAWMVWRRR